MVYACDSAALWKMTGPLSGWRTVSGGSNDKLNPGVNSGVRCRCPAVSDWPIENCPSEIVRWDSDCMPGGVLGHTPLSPPAELFFVGKKGKGGTMVGQMMH